MYTETRVYIDAASVCAQFIDFFLKKIPIFFMKSVYTLYTCKFGICKNTLCLYIKTLQILHIYTHSIFERHSVYIQTLHLSYFKTLHIYAFVYTKTLLIYMYKNTPYFKNTPCMYKHSIFHILKNTPYIYMKHSIFYKYNNTPYLMYI